MYEAIATKPHARIDKKRWSADFQDFIDKCLEKKPKNRWTVPQLLNHNFLADKNIDAWRESWKMAYVKHFEAEFEQKQKD